MLKSIRRARPDGAPIYTILDNLSANPLEAQFGPLRAFVMSNSDHPNHTAQTRKLHAYLRWRKANARHPDVLAAQRRERAHIRSAKQRRRRRPAIRAA
ncbi:hypothetical protein LDL49_53565 [Nonomuraea sp. NEAU-L178]|nr:hypothetical protein [Nonomuraea aurantiaca]